MIIELKEVETLASIKVANSFGLNQTYMAEYNGERYLGKFVNKSVGESPELESWNFVWNGSIFPTGIPFECLDKVWEVKELS